MNVLAAGEAYRRWAPTYARENAFSTLECALVDRLSPSPDGLRLLDVGCGTGRRLVGTGAAYAVGVELCAEMLAAGREEHDFGPEVRLLEGDARALPVADASFDLLWCRLVIGHLPECSAVFRELGRAAAAGATIVVTDFHPAAYKAGFRRTFRDKGEVLEAEHYVHTLPDQLAAARDTGLELVDVRDAVVGPEARSYYEEASRLGAYERQLGFPMVQALVFRMGGAECAS